MPPTLHREIWAAFRPYLKFFMVDLLIGVSLWFFLAVFRGVTTLVQVREQAGRWIAIIHSAGVVIAFGILAGFFVLDIIRLKRGKSAGSAVVQDPSR